MSQRKSHIIVLSGLTLLATHAYAVETTSVIDSMSVVGIIAGEKRTADNKTQVIGIAVLRDGTSQRTMTLNIGDAVPMAPEYKITKVEKNFVLVSDGITTKTINYPVAGSDTKPEVKVEEPEQEDETMAQFEAQPSAVPSGSQALARRLQALRDERATQRYFDIEEAAHTYISELPVTELNFDEIEITPRNPSGEED